MEQRPQNSSQKDRDSNQLNDRLPLTRKREATLHKRTVRDLVWSGIATLLLHILMFAAMISPILQLPIIHASQELDFFWLSPFFTMDSGLVAKETEGIAPPPLPPVELPVEEPGADEENLADTSSASPAPPSPVASPPSPEISASEPEMVVPRKVAVTPPPQPVDDGIKPPPAMQEPEKMRSEPPQISP